MLIYSGDSKGLGHGDLRMLRLGVMCKSVGLCASQSLASSWPTSFLSFLTSSLSASQRVLPPVLSCRWYFPRSCLNKNRFFQTEKHWKTLAWRDGGSFTVCRLCQCYPINGCPILLLQMNADLWHNIAQSQRNQRTYRNVLIQVPAARCSKVLTQVSRKPLLGKSQAQQLQAPRAFDAYAIPLISLEYLWIHPNNINIPWVWPDL